MSFRYHAPLDPACPTVASWRRAEAEDPMGRAYGAPMDEIIKAWEARHAVKCDRCRLYGCANIEVTEVEETGVQTA